MARHSADVSRSQIYLVSQEQFDVPPAEELKKMDAEVEEKRKELATLTAENNKLAAKVRQVRFAAATSRPACTH